SASSNASHAFVVKLNAAGTDFEYATYVAGGNSDFGRRIAVDGSGAAYLFGTSESPDFPITPGPIQSVGDSLIGVPFLSKLSADGSRLLYSTFIGNRGDFAQAVAVDAGGSAVVELRSPDGPARFFRLDSRGTLVIWTRTLPTTFSQAPGAPMTMD